MTRYRFAEFYIWLLILISLVRKYTNKINKHNGVNVANFNTVYKTEGASLQVDIRGYLLVATSPMFQIQVPI